MYETRSRVRYSECASDALLTIHGLVNRLQDTSIFHTEDAGGGIGALHERGYAWYVAAWQIRIARMPHFGETIAVKTWLPRIGGLVCERDFVVESSEGEELVRVASNWFLYDVSVNQPVHPPADVVAPYLGEETPALDMPRTKMKIKLEGEAHEAPRRVVDESLLDTNRHVNNANYIEVAREAAGFEEHPSCIEAIYRQAATLGDVFCPVVAKADGATTIDLQSPEGTSFCVVRFS